MRASTAWRIGGVLLVGWVLVLVYMSATLYQAASSGTIDEAAVQRARRGLDNVMQNGDLALLDQVRALQRQNKQLRAQMELQPNNRFNGQPDDQLNLSPAVPAVDNKLAKSHDKSNQISEQSLSHSLKLQLNDAQAKIDSLKAQLNKRSQVGTKDSVFGEFPDYDHERLRRKITNGQLEFWFYIRSQLSQLHDLVSPSVQERIDSLVNVGFDHYSTLMTDLYNLSLSNGAKSWRANEARELSDLVQRRLRYLQNPTDCSTARKLVCNLNKGCGYGCQVHHLAYCLIIAYGTRRTLVLESRGWRYNRAGWEAVFQPLSDTCTSRAGSSHRNWGPEAVIRNTQVVELPIVDSLRPRPAFMPLTVPADLAPRLRRLHGMPPAWWLGQIVAYLLRPQPHLRTDIDNMATKLGYKHPIVGMHIRRTDKVGTEASFHGIEEYMQHVDDYYAQLEKQQSVTERRVYLATDDPHVLAEARRKYPSYTFLSENSFSQKAGLGSRYSDASLRGIIMDVHFLSQSNYLVCTFSSQVCRLAYEIMQTLHPDASTFFHSLDDIYYYGGQNAHNQVALEKHIPNTDKEIPLMPGDKLGIAGNHWNGFSMGINRRLGRTGLYPSFKVEEVLDTADFPTYEEADHTKQN